MRLRWQEYTEELNNNNKKGLNDLDNQDSMVTQPRARHPGVGSQVGLPTPVFWPREFRGLYSPWGHKELDPTE